MQREWTWTRRRFLRLTSIALGTTLGACARSARPVGPPPDPMVDDEPMPGPIEGESLEASAERDVPRRPLGRTGQSVSMFGLGGYHLGKPDEALAIAIMHRAIDEGITFFDNCWDYHQGESERRMGKALRGGKRDEVFLMTKLDGRTAEAATQQLEDSLQRLETDRIDLVQVHEVIREKDPAWVFGPDGAIEALIRAREAGKLRFIGFTGHKDPSIHLAMLEEAQRHGFRFDTVQMPLNVLDPHYRSFEKNVLPRLVRQEIGVLGMKALASGAILETGVVDAPTCLRYAASLPSDVVITGCESMRDLDQALAVARGFERMDGPAMAALLERTAPIGRGGEREGFKTSEQFDATARNPRWLTTASI